MRSRTTSISRWWRAAGATSGTRSRAAARSGGAPDHRNNVEGVYLPAGLSGPLSVEVIGAAISDDSRGTTDQDFALVVSNASEQPTPAVAGKDVSVDDSGSGGDNDAALESGEQAELEAPVENAGTVTATGVTGTLVGGAGLSVDAPGSSGYPNIASGDVQENTSPFVAQMRPTRSAAARTPKPRSRSPQRGRPVHTPSRSHCRPARARAAASERRVRDRVAGLDPRR